MESFISWNELIWKSKTRHKPSFLYPKDSTERSWKENSFYWSKGYQSFSKAVLIINPSKCPISLFLDYWNIVYCLQKVIFLSLIFDIRVDQKGVHLRMHIFHHYLKSIEASSFWNLNFSAEFLSKVFIYYTVRGSKEGKNVFDKMLFIFGEFFPMFLILR